MMLIGALLMFGVLLYAATKSTSFAVFITFLGLGFVAVQTMKGVWW